MKYDELEKLRMEDDRRAKLRSECTTRVYNRYYCNTCKHTVGCESYFCEACNTKLVKEFLDNELTIELNSDIVGTIKEYAIMEWCAAGMHVKCNIYATRWWYNLYDEEHEECLKNADFRRNANAHLFRDCDDEKNGCEKRKMCVGGRHFLDDFCGCVENEDEYGEVLDRNCDICNTRYCSEGVSLICSTCYRGVSQDILDRYKIHNDEEEVSMTKIVPVITKKVKIVPVITKKVKINPKIFKRVFRYVNRDTEPCYIDDDDFNEEQDREHKKRINTCLCHKEIDEICLRCNMRVVDMIEQTFGCDICGVITEYLEEPGEDDEDAYNRAVWWEIHHATC